MVPARMAPATASSPSAGSSNPVFVAVALGSNLGDRRGHLTWALERLSDHLVDLRVSRVIETAPEGVDEPQPPYLNAVAVGHSRLAPRALLEVLLKLEHERGRTRASRRAARTLDLDLILYGDEIINDDNMVVPHPRFRERRFVLGPLAEIAPNARDPVTGKTMAELLTTL